MSKRKQHAPECKVKVAPEALKGEETAPNGHHIELAGKLAGILALGYGKQLHTSTLGSRAEGAEGAEKV